MNKERVLGALFVISHEANKMAKYVEEYGFDCDDPKVLDLTKQLVDSYDFFKWVLEHVDNN